MVFPAWLVNYLPKIIGLLIIGLVLNSIHGCIYESGANSVKLKYAEEQAAKQDKLDKLIIATTDLQNKNRAENQRISDQLAKQDKEHEVTIAKLTADYNNRLRSSEARQTRYQSMSKGGTSECSNLASYAAQFDRSLEEGRYLVRELRKTLEFRDGQVILLGNQLQSDRALISEVGTNDGR